MIKLKTDKCSFCNRKTKKVPLFIYARTAAICSDCLVLATQELFRRLALLKK